MFIHQIKWSSFSSSPLSIGIQKSGHHSVRALPPSLSIPDSPLRQNPSIYLFLIMLLLSRLCCVFFCVFFRIRSTRYYSVTSYLASFRFFEVYVFCFFLLNFPSVEFRLWFVDFVGPVRVFWKCKKKMESNMVVFIQVTKGVFPHTHTKKSILKLSGSYKKKKEEAIWLSATNHPSSDKLLV